MDCIYLAAGIGKRLKQEIPKQFFKIKGKPILVYALEVIEKIDWIDNIFVTYNAEYKELYEKVFIDYNISKVTLIEGGLSRQESVFKALKNVKSQKVLIHEAARPIVFASFIERFKDYENEIAIVPTIPIPFTVSEGNDCMTGILDRSNLHNIQLPQMFDTKVLIEAHGKAVVDKFNATEDSILVYKYGNRVKFIEGYENNLKITTPFDILIAEQLLTIE